MTPETKRALERLCTGTPAEDDAWSALRESGTAPAGDAGPARERSRRFRVRLRPPCRGGRGPAPRDHPRHAGEGVRQPAAQRARGTQTFLVKMSRKIDPNDVQPEMCPTCPWRPGSPYANLAPDLRECAARRQSLPKQYPLVSSIDSITYFRFAKDFHRRRSQNHIIPFAMKPHLLVTFRSRFRSRRVWLARFECGAENALEAVRVAWRHNAEIIATENVQ